MRSATASASARQASGDTQAGQPAEVRREERWWFLGHVVERLGVATVRLVILRARAGGGDAIHEALLAALRARPVAG